MFFLWKKTPQHSSQSLFSAKNVIQVHKGRFLSWFCKKPHPSSTLYSLLDNLVLSFNWLSLRHIESLFLELTHCLYSSNEITEHPMFCIHGNPESWQWFSVLSVNHNLPNKILSETFCQSILSKYLSITFDTYERMTFLRHCKIYSFFAIGVFLSIFSLNH